MSNSTETAVMGHGDGARCSVEVADGIESHEDASIGHRDAQTVEMDADTTENAPQIVRMLRKKKPPNSPIEAARQRLDNSNTIRNPTDTPRVRTDVHNIANNTQTTENAPRIIRTHQNVLKIRNLPIGTEKWLVDAAHRMGSHHAMRTCWSCAQMLQTTRKRLKTKRRKLERVRQKSSHPRASVDGEESAQAMSKCT